MKFARHFGKPFLFSLIICLSLLSYIHPLKANVKSFLSTDALELMRQTGIEQQTFPFIIYNNNSELISSGDVTMKLIQNQQEVNGTNKYVGYFETKVQAQHNNFTPHVFLQQLPNFGKLEGSDTVQIDLRYIIGCVFDVREDANGFTVLFQLISKESTSQHIYHIELKLPVAGNKLAEVKKYFENISKVCLSTQETIQALKDGLIKLCKANLARKKKQIKIKNMSEEERKKKLGGGMGINATDIQDPTTKNLLEHLEETLKKSHENYKTLQTKKDTLTKRAAEIMERLDKDNQMLTVMTPKNELNSKNAVSANDTIKNAESNITEIDNKNSDLNTQLKELSDQKTKQDSAVKDLSDKVSNLKSDLNKLEEEQKAVTKQISDVESKITVDTQTLKNLEDKKNQILSQTTELTNAIKTQNSDVESGSKSMGSVQTNLDNLNQDAKKTQTSIDELKKKLDELRKKENEIKKNIDPKALSALETQQQGVLSQLSAKETTLVTKKDELVAYIDSTYGDIITKAFAQISNKDNFDQDSYLNILKTIPSYVWSGASGAATTSTAAATTTSK
jgi:chromosome segregation ATPase